MMKKTFIISFIFCLNLVFSQNQANTWYFGNKAGLNFNSGTATALFDGELNTLEGCATISNAAGQLLFYTDGVTVYDRTHQVMQNGTGLLGHPSSTQSAIIVPNPSNPNIYYIFTTTELFLSEGVRYSEVDLSLNGGLGAVTVNKNIVLLSGEVTEKLTSVKHANGQDYWVMCHDYANDTYHAFAITSSGVNMSSVTSYIGSVLDTTFSKYGYLKFSADASMLANAVSKNSSNSIELFDFNNATGILSNLRVINCVDTPYGIEFSASGDILYITKYQFVNFNTIYFYLVQYDLTSSDIEASEQIIYNVIENGDYSLGALQMAPDGKIYLSIDDSITPNHFISSIENPEVLGSGCNFILNSINLYPGACRMGLPQFIQSFFSTGINAEEFCYGSSTQFSLNNTDGVTSVNWDFGDGNLAAGLSTNHIYANTGIYTVSATVVTATETIIKTIEIIISAVPTATQPNPILVCDDNNNGFYNFDLTQNTATILNGQSTSQFGVNYYASPADFTNKVKIANPTSYQNTLLSYQSQNIIAEVYNIENASCNDITNFNIQVFESPQPNINVSVLQKCDNTSFGSDADGKVVFDLTERQNTILNGQTTPNFTVEYYSDSGLTSLITTPSNYVNTNATETIYVKVFNTQNPSCVATTSFQIQVFSLPIVNTTVSLKQCDDNNDGFSSFNLNEALQLISTNTLYTFSFHETHTLATQNSQPITNLTAYQNQIVSNDQVFVRVQNANGCFRVVTLNLVVSTTQISNTIQEDFYVCDDAASGSITDGIATFNFSSVDAQIVSQYPSGQLLDITYYRNITDALAEQNAIIDISNYTNIGYPNTQNIYVRVDSQLNNECIGLGHHITLHVERIPIIQSHTYTQCDDNHDGFFAFNTTNLQSDVLNGLTNVTLSYWDANNNPLPSPLPNPFNTTSQTIRVRATNNTTSACFYESTITFKVDDLPEAFAIPTNLTTVCDDEANPVNQDGIYPFDTSSFQNTILGTQTGMIVNYYDGNGNSLSSPLPNPFLSRTQNIRVEVINPLNTTCKAYLTIPLVVQPVPEIELYGDELICSNNPLFTKEISAGLLDETTLSNYTYQWFLNNNPISGATNYTLTVNTEGIYTVEVTNSNGCVRTRTLTVTASNIATIENVQVVDLSDENSVTVLVTGLGDYEYSLDNEYWQTSNVFSNIEAGIYTVYVKDLNGCGVATEEISVLGIPNYFTPNNDGYNDYWNIKGINSRLNAETIIYIFDRYGKLVKQISPLSQGWDGTFNGNQMHSSDYWYSVLLEDGRVVKGHFSLKR
ncbi:T9SS type B sorting domain-containing protein [Flavobacterium sp.]|uniref:T9SS type B sorting domain-containing protein n=1 Tax=Flavobacterium sp. TaxID=239 RepID=UPI004048B850